MKLETEHNCEIPAWRCHGNGPIYLSVERFRQDGCEGYPYLDIYGHSDDELKITEVNYCPFCGYSLPMAGLKEKNELD